MCPPKTLAIALFALIPASGYARSPLTDSTDVAIPASAVEVENFVVASPLNSKVLLLSNRLLPYGSTTWISRNAGMAGSWSNNQTLEANSSNPAPLIGKRGGGPSGDGRFYVNYNVGPGEFDRDVKVVFKGEASSTWGDPVTILSFQQNPDGQGGIRNHLWVDNTVDSQFEHRMYCGWSEDTGPRVLMKWSINDGASWTPALDQLPQPVDAAEGPDWNVGINLHSGGASAGRLYAVFNTASTQTGPAGGIGFRISEFGGQGWKSPCPMPPCSPSTENSRQRIRLIAGLPRHYLCCRGKTMEANSYPSMAVVREAPPHDLASLVGLGNIFIVYAAINTPNSDTNIYVIKSTDGGNNWSDPVRVNQDPVNNDKDQWHPWISWDDCTGALAVVFYDSRDFPGVGGDGVNTYMAVSYPPMTAFEPQLGDSWTDFKVSDSTWTGDPVPSCACAGGSPSPGFAGAHIGVAARDGIAFPVWSDDRNQTQGNYKPFVSPIPLWGVMQETIMVTVVSDPGMTAYVTVSWGTNRRAPQEDVLVLTAPSGLEYSSTCGSCSPDGGYTHSVTTGVPCEPGQWTFIVKSTRVGFTKRGSNRKSFNMNCLD